MTARTHDLAAITALGITAALVALPSVSLSTVLVAILANQIGGIAPDIDQPTAPFWRNLPSGSFFGRIVDKLLGGHRFLSHSLVGLALFAFLSNLLLHFLHPIMPHVDIQLVWYAFLIGVVSHLLMDTLTKEGVPWLLPIPIKFGFPPLKALRVTTGKHIETLVVFPGLLVLDIWLCASHYSTLVLFIHQHVRY
ncbi:MAG TPA: metal-dependent hydrolase [Candidatus Saccharimonadales bacterium]|nr:metal-dependent hydrolase [Candidatus Saccharimonadales bacterium]